jgi:hypothetical protein
VASDFQKDFAPVSQASKVPVHVKKTKNFPDVPVTKVSPAVVAVPSEDANVFDLEAARVVFQDAGKADKGAAIVQTRGTVVEVVIVVVPVTKAVVRDVPDVLINEDVQVPILHEGTVENWAAVAVVAAMQAYPISLAAIAPEAAVKRKFISKKSEAVAIAVEKVTVAVEVQIEAPTVVALVQVAVPRAAVPITPSPRAQKATETARARMMNFIYVY